MLAFIQQHYKTGWFIPIVKIIIIFFLFVFTISAFICNYIYNNRTGFFLNGLSFMSFLIIQTIGQCKFLILKFYRSKSPLTNNEPSSHSNYIINLFYRLIELYLTILYYGKLQRSNKAQQMQPAEDTQKSNKVYIIIFSSISLTQ